MSVPGLSGPTDPARSWALSRVTDDANLAASLRRVATAGAEMLEHCTSASVTVIAAGRPATMAATDDVALLLDRAQYDIDDGPCLIAARQERLVRIDAMHEDRRWPSYRQSALDQGVVSSLSVPLHMEDSDVLGGLNLYGDTAGGFSDADVETAEAFALQATIVVANVVAYWTALELTMNLTAAMEHRGAIEQAKGIVMASERCSPDEAFSILRRRSQAENRKLREIAISIVADIQQNPSV